MKTTKTKTKTKTTKNTFFVASDATECISKKRQPCLQYTCSKRFCKTYFVQLPEKVRKSEQKVWNKNTSKTLLFLEDPHYCNLLN